MAANESVSVVIPCYNGERFLKETLDSIVGQTKLPQEVIVVDDGSTDNSPTIARQYGDLVRVISQPNQGESVARNRGAREAKSKWIAYLDADDIWQPQRLELQFQQDTSDKVALHSNLYFFGAQTGETRIEDTEKQKRYSIDELCINNHFLTPSAVIVRRECNPLFPEKIRYGEDLVFLLELVQLGDIGFVSDRLVGYRKHSGAQSQSAKSRIGWFETISEWISQHPQKFTAEAKKRVLDHRIEELVAFGWKLKEQRRWQELREVKAFLQSFANNPSASQFLANRVYPSPVYSVLDFVTQRLGGKESK